MPWGRLKIGVAAVSGGNTKAFEKFKFKLYIIFYNI
jgi:hypothetical protein